MTLGIGSIGVLEFNHPVFQIRSHGAASQDWIYTGDTSSYFEAVVLNGVADL